MRKFINLLSQINGGNLIEGQNDNDTVRNLFSDIASLCIDKVDNKHYFMAKYIHDGNKDNLAEIEAHTIRNIEIWGRNRPNPSDSYLILFWEVDVINENTISKVIEIEENEYFYKKYVFYYTKKELLEFQKWIEMQDNVSISKILNAISDEKEISEKFFFVIRLFIKIPFWKLEFEKGRLEDFEGLVKNKIVSIRSSSKDEILELLQYISDLDASEELNEEILADKIYSKYVMG